MTEATQPEGAAKHPSAFPVYFQAAAIVFPSLVIWRFSNVFLLPKLWQLWKIAGLTNSSAQWLMDTSYFLMDRMKFVFWFFVLALIGIEHCWSAWTRFRRGTILTLAVVLQTAILVGVTAIACGSLLAVPMLAKKAKTPNAYTPASVDPSGSNP